MATKSENKTHYERHLIYKRDRRNFTFIEKQEAFCQAAWWGHLHWSLTLTVPGVDVSAKVKQQFHHRRAVFLCRCMQRRVQGFAFLNVSA